MPCLACLTLETLPVPPPRAQAVPYYVSACAGCWRDPPLPSVMSNHAHSRAHQTAHKRTSEKTLNRQNSTGRRPASEASTHTTRYLHPKSSPESSIRPLLSLFAKEPFCTLSNPTPRVTASPTARSNPTRPPELAHWRRPELF